MFEYSKGKESAFSNESGVKFLKIGVLTLLLSTYFFFLVWAAASPLISSPIKSNILGISVLVFIVVALVVVVYIYSQYFVSVCPNCGKKLFFTNVRDYIRCFKCGRHLKIDFQNKKLIDPERKD